MIQGGCPNGTGTSRLHDSRRVRARPEARRRGRLLHGQRGPNTGGSQFFITLAPTPWVDGKHAVFGRVTEGIEVVRAIGKVQTGMGDRPRDKVVMESVTVSEG